MMAPRSSPSPGNGGWWYACYEAPRAAVAQLHATLVLAAVLGLSARVERADELAWSDVAASRT